MTFHDAYDYADAVFSTQFELLPTNYNWNASETGIVNMTQIPVLVRPFDGEARKLMISKQLQKSMDDIRDLSQGKKVIPYRVYSAHDTNVANILE